MSLPSNPPKTTPINDPPDNNTETAIGLAFFKDGFQANGGLLAFRDYFKHYHLEIDALHSGFDDRHHQSKELAITTHEEVITVVKELHECTKLMRTAIRPRLLQKLPNEQNLGLNRAIEFPNKQDEQDKQDLRLNRAIDIAIRWWLLINVREECFQDLYPRRPVREWNDKGSLEDFIKDTFPSAKSSLSARESRLNPFFTAANMVKICGLKIQWTPYLDDHLRLDHQSGEHPVLWVFSFKRCLNAFLYQRYEGSPADAGLIPRTVLEETLLSLDLLFPTWDKGTKDFLRRANQNFHNIQPYTKSRPLNLQQFDHWRDRLLEVYEQVYLAPPVSFAQLWYDRRNPQQWWTFWIALFIGVLTVISTATGIMQTVTSW